MNPKINKGIILAGGQGTRLFPSTKTIGKPLLPVYDKPLIYYPMSTLINLGIKEILLISTERDLPGFKYLFGDGSQFGINIQYDIQSIAKGIPDAFVIGEDFIGDDSITLILGDNVFDPIDTVVEAVKQYDSGSMTFGFPVEHPDRFGVAELDDDGNVISMEEKPDYPRSNLAIIGLYIFDNQVPSVAKNLTPSERGELEILHVIQHYLDRKMLKFHNLGPKFNWFDAGSPDSMHEVAKFVLEKNNTCFGAVEVASLEQGNIDRQQFKKLIDAMPNCLYRNDLEAYLKELD